MNVFINESCTPELDIDWPDRIENYFLTLAEIADGTTRLNRNCKTMPSNIRTSFRIFTGKFCPFLIFITESKFFRFFLVSQIKRKEFFFLKRLPAQKKRNFSDK